MNYFDSNSSIQVSGTDFSDGGTTLHGVHLGVEARWSRRKFSVR